jgi:lipid A disaccharide synthetase
MASPPKVGDIIKMRSWHGIVLDVFTNEMGKTILRVQTVRNIFRRLNPEFIEFDLAPESISSATLNDLQAEVEDYQESLNESIRELLSKAKMNGASNQTRAKQH